MKPYFDRFRAFWAARQPREKNFLIALSLFVTLAIVAQLLWASHNARDRLKKQVPQLQQEVEALQRKASDLQMLRARPPSPTPAEGSALLAAAISSAEAVGLREVRSQLKLETPRRFRLKGNLPFDRWVEWISVLQRDAQVRLVSCRIQASAIQGVPEIDAVFALPDPS